MYLTIEHSHFGSHWFVRWVCGPNASSTAASIPVKQVLVPGIREIVCLLLIIANLKLDEEIVTLGLNVPYTHKRHE